MGLISALVGAASGALADSWRDYFSCDAIPADVLVIKGNKREAKRSTNTKGSDNLISNGSIIAVNDGQCMVIVEQGKVVEICAEPGEFVYDTSTEPSLFYGDLGTAIVDTFKQIGKRFAFGGDTSKDQRIYYFNTKEITGNKYGTANPVPFRVVDNNVGLDVDVSVRCHGEYSYKIVDPIRFYTNVCGNVTDSYKRSEIDSQLKTELLTALQPAFAKISEMGIRYSAVPAHAMELSDALNEVLSKKWGELRGLSIVSFGVNSITISEEDEQMIKDLQKYKAAGSSEQLGAGMMGIATAEAMKAAASNTSAGPMMAFAGMNMAQQAGGNIAGMYAAAGAHQAAAPAAAGWPCSCGATGNTGKFCANCGKPQPAAGWSCSCGATGNTGKFCSNCGKPQGGSFKCDKCGWVPEDPANLPKFCPECGDPFNDADRA